MRKDMLAGHYASVGLGAVPGGAPSLVPLVGWTELLLGAAILIAPFSILLALAFVWKISTELLYPASGAPVWEFIERGGSYAAPLGLLILQRSAKPAAVPATREPAMTAAEPVVREVRS